MALWKAGRSKWVGGGRYWRRLERVNSSMNSRGNGRVSSTDELCFVDFNFFWKLAFCMMFWTSLVDGWRCFWAKQRLLITGFWRVAEFDVEMMNLEFLPFAWHFACACSTTNPKPGFISAVLWTRSLWNWFYVFLHVSNWKACFGRMWCVSTTFAWPTFSLERWMILLWNLCSSTAHVNRIKDRERHQQYRGK